MYQLYNLFPGFSPLSENNGELFAAWCSCRVLMPALYLIFSELSWDTWDNVQHSTWDLHKLSTKMEPGHTGQGGQFRTWPPCLMIHYISLLLTILNALTSGRKRPVHHVAPAGQHLGATQLPICWGSSNSRSLRQRCAPGDGISLRSVRCTARWHDGHEHWLCIPPEVAPHCAGLGASHPQWNKTWRYGNMERIGKVWKDMGSPKPSLLSTAIHCSSLLITAHHCSSYGSGPSLSSAR